jgi:Domain of unknown function (DUF2760)
MDQLGYVVAAACLVVGVGIGFVFGRFSTPPAIDQPPPRPSSLKKSTGTPLRLLALLQREGRLLDFLLEDIQGYADAQVGAAVRDIHRNCRKAIEEHLTLERILPGEEGSEVTIPVGFNPAMIQLTGNVTGQPPFRGTLQHHGWRVKEVKLPEVAPGKDEYVVAPAEVALS